jgi:fluoroacetyl-CoA thioesterase
MTIAIPAHLTYTQELMIDSSLTVPQISDKFTGFSDMPQVFATAYLVGFVEWTCVEALAPYLDPQQKTVGTSVNLSHSAATPIGMKVTAEVTLRQIEGKKLSFTVICRDEVDVICEGTHERFIIDHEKFMTRVQSKCTI